MNFLQYMDGFFKDKKDPIGLVVADQLVGFPDFRVIVQRFEMHHTGAGSSTERVLTIFARTEKNFDGTACFTGLHCVLIFPGTLARIRIDKATKELHGTNFVFTVVGRFFNSVGQLQPVEEDTDDIGPRPVYVIARKASLRLPGGIWKRDERQYADVEYLLLNGKEGLSKAAEGISWYSDFKSKEVTKFETADCAGLFKRFPKTFRQYQAFALPEGWNWF